jgi:pyruvate dehydrogenase E2 component (dihydrolipoamide acetyltransferase)
MKEIVMPRFDPEMKSGKVVEWLKKEGDKVQKGEPVVRIDTEKVSLDVESPESGTLSKILVNPITEVPVGAPLGILLLEGEKAGAMVSPTSTTPAVPSVVQTPSIKPTSPPAEEATTSRTDWVRASPSARRAARELGVDLKEVRGTGPMGRVTSKDIEAHRPAQVGVVESLGEVPKIEVVSQPQTPLQTESFTVKHLDSMRTTIAQRMTQSWTEIPQVPLFSDVSLVEAEKFKASMEKLIGKRVTLTAIVAKALSSAMKYFPELNSRFENGEIRVFDDVDVSIAVALDSGLIGPVIRRANRKTATNISSEIEDLASRARSGKLAPSEVRGGTTTVSNLGGYGVDSFIPIINPPQVTILGVGKTRSGPTGHPICTLTLVFDHRVTDGARAAQLLQKIREFIESPYLLQMA